MSTYLYLHGFASGPHSAKGVYLRDRLQALQQPLLIPDLNQADFSHLSLTRQIQQVETLLATITTPVTLIGSSLGGLTAAWVAQRQPQVQRLILLAPAFQFLTHWLPQLGEVQLQQWQQQQYLSVYHYGEQRSLPLHYGFITDATTYDEAQLQRPVPTLILHGEQDEVIPFSASQAFAAHRPWVQLVCLADNHALSHVQAEIWQQICQFCQLPQPVIDTVS